MTVNDALKVLLEARERTGGDATLILSLTDSEIEDRELDSMVLVDTVRFPDRIRGDDAKYVECRCCHPTVNALGNKNDKALSQWLQIAKIELEGMQGLTRFEKKLLRELRLRFPK